MPDLTPEVERELEAIDHALEGRRVAADLTELGELALLLREERPQPSDGFVRHLDHRAARGFPGRDPRARASGRRWLAWHGWMGPALGVATTAMLIALVGVLGSGGSDDSEGGGSGGGQVAMQEAAPNAGGGGTASDNAGAVEESTSGRSAE